MTAPDPRIRSFSLAVKRAAQGKDVMVERQEAVNRRKLTYPPHQIDVERHLAAELHEAAAFLESLLSKENASCPA